MSEHCATAMPACTARERLTLGSEYCGPAKMPVCSDSEPGSCAHWRSRANLVRDKRQEIAKAAELELAPPDFFVDELSADNFLRASLVALAGATSDASGVDAGVRGALELLWRFVRERFGLDVPQLMRDEDEFADDEDMPVVEDVDGVLQVTRDLQQALRQEIGADEDPDTEMS